MKEIKIDKLIRSKRRTIALIISSEAALIVRAPLRTPLEYIQNLIFQKRFWIDEKKKQVLRNGLPTKSKEFINGEEFLYLNEKYELKILRQAQDGESIKLADYLFFPEKYLSDSRAKMIEWYKYQALEKISERVIWYSQITGWKFKSITISNAEKRWGSCGAKGSINFSWKLIMAPIEVVDYVVVHELAHLIERNHSSKFWNKVKTILPDYQAQQKWLRKNGKSLKI